MQVTQQSVAELQSVAARFRFDATTTRLNKVVPASH